MRTGATDTRTGLARGHSRFPAIRLILLGAAFLVAVSRFAGAQGETAEQDRFAVEREIESTKEKIRQLYAEGQFEEVVKSADHLLTLEPDNKTAILWKDLAERKLLSRPSDDASWRGLGASIRASEIPRAKDDVPYEYESPITVPTPMPAATPAAPGGGSGTPSSPLTRLSTGGLLPRWALLAIAGVAGAAVLVALVAWVRLRASRRKLDEALSSARSKRDTSRDRTKSLADMQTAVQEGETREVTGVEPLTDALTADEQTMSDEVTDVIKGLNIGPDEESVFEYGGVGMPDMDTRGPEPVVPSLGSFAPSEKEETSPAKADSQYSDVEEVEGDTFREVGSTEIQLPGLGKAEPPKVDSLGSAPLESRGPAAAQTGGTTGGASFNSVMFAEDETLKPREEPIPAESGSETKGGASFDSLMFDQEAETRMPGAEPTAKAPDQTSAEDPNALSYNSLMFNAADETKMGSTSAPKKSPKDNDDMTNTSFSNEYQNLMFGQGSEETKGVGTPEKAPDFLEGSISLDGGLDLAAGEGIGDQTLPLAPAPSAADEQEVTIKLEPGEANRTPDEMFLHQKTAGLKALGQGDYVRAVQCLSLAATLNPGDAEVGSKLREARKLRDS
ncbi:hypothetical protein HZA57_04395 [Candidatus Poribacteria bacterium]|nr:hypothetical protein [Candidatus Poribacteria bacterium]